MNVKDIIGMEVYIADVKGGLTAMKRFAIFTLEASETG
jgi:hypothetical protein